MKARLLPIALACAGLLAVLHAAPIGADEREAPPPLWSESVLELVATLPVQSEGRVKPLQTWAAVLLLRLNHRRTVVDAADREVGAVAWLLDVILRPDWARRHRCFLIENDAVLDALALPHADRKKRDRYSFEDFIPARDRLAAMGGHFGGGGDEELSPVEEATARLAHDVAQFEWLLEFLAFGRERVAVPRNETLAAVFPGRDRVRVSDVVAAAPGLVGALEAQAGRDPLPPEDALHIQDLLERTRRLGTRGRSLALFPPAGPKTEQERWLSPADVCTAAIDEGWVQPADLAMLRMLESLPALVDDPAGLTTQVRALHTESTRRARERGEYGSIELEVFLGRLDPFHKGLVLYLAAFLLLAVGWLRPRSRWIVRAAVAATLAGLTLHIGGIVIRCVIRGRPPVSTLYETMLFVSAFAVLASLVIERMNRQRIAVALAPLLGALGLFLAGRYEVIEGADTMPQLEAVLDTNFWLATHVTCITIGYAAALLAGALAHVHLLGRAFGLRRRDTEFYRGLARMVYGVIGFGLVFAVVGTILGGIWANDSWGRFWGWDPKENGALMIVLFELAILHGRLGGHLRAHGLCMAAVVLSCLVAFSWWGVNLLGIGLHSYGFASGVWTGLKLFYAFEGAVLLTGAAWWIQEQKATRTASSTDRGP